MTSVRRFQLDELTLRPGTYFNPQTEVMIVVDDSPEVDHEIFETEDLDSSDWVLISEDIPIDEHGRDDLVERFQLSHRAGDGDPLAERDEDVDDEDEDDELDGLDEEDEEEDDELDGVDDLELRTD